MTATTHSTFTCDNCGRTETFETTNLGLDAINPGDNWSKLSRDILTQFPRVTFRDLPADGCPLTFCSILCVETWGNASLVAGSDSVAFIGATGTAHIGASKGKRRRRWLRTRR